jgi:hypothetical protein
MPNQAALWSSLLHLCPLSWRCKTSSPPPRKNAPPLPLCRALLAMEVARVQQYPFTDNQPVVAADWELYVAEVAADMLREQSPRCLLQVPC